jgi:hypothetical protein
MLGAKQLQHSSMKKIILYSLIITLFCCSTIQNAGYLRAKNYRRSPARQLRQAESGCFTDYPKQETATGLI